MSDSAAGSSLSAVVERLGPTVLAFEAGPEHPDRVATSFVLYDAAAPQPVAPGALVGAVGLAGTAPLVALVAELGRQGVAALLVRHPVSITPAVRAAAESSRLPVLGLPAGTSWIRVATEIAAVLAAGGAAESSPAETRADLFPLADALARVLHAPVTIEDLATRVLAFSAHQAGADDIRRETILGREVPAAHKDASRRRGHFRAIYASDRPVFIERREAGRLSRAVMRIQVGDELLGSIWAAVRDRPTPVQEQAMVDAAAVVATTIVRARLAADAAQRERRELVTALLEGGQRAREAAQQLDLSSRAAFVAVLGVRDEPTGDADLEASLQRIAAALAMHLAALVPRSVSAVVGNLVYAVVPLTTADPDPARTPERILSGFAQRRDGGREIVGVGGPVPDVGDLARSRRQAEGALRVLRSRPGDSRRVATLESVKVESLLLRLADSLREEGEAVGGGLAVLAAHDAEHGTPFVATVRAWLDEFGDIAACAHRFHVHKNTFRYRLSRAVEIGGLDLSDPETRFGLMLQLRLGPRVD